MKKIFYSLFALSTLLFTATSCTEDKGTTTEVEDSNADEDVNPNHIRGYDDTPGGTPEAENANNAISTPVNKANSPANNSGGSTAMGADSAGGSTTGGNTSAGTTAGGNSGEATSGSGNQTGQRTTGSGNQ